MKGKSNGMASNRPNYDGQRREEWRARVPELRRLVEEVAPQMWEHAASSRVDTVPDDWRALVSAMQTEVRAKADQQAAEYPDSDQTQDERRGFYWSLKMARVEDMLDHLQQIICDDLGFKDGETLASMLLVRKAMEQLQAELQHGAREDGEDRDENHFRVHRALKALTPRFDDVHLLRIRALQIAESAAKLTRIPSDADVEERVGRLRQRESVTPEEADRHRDYMKVDNPVVSGLLARSWLAEVDERFGALDPLVVLEEFGEAQAQTRGGKADGGDGKVGPVRALARLAVMSGALDYSQHDDEDFDAAVDRARGNLLVTRSRIKKLLRAFPGRVPSGDDQEV